MKGIYLALLILAIAPAYAQTISVEGDVVRPGSMSMKGFGTLPSIEVKAKDKEGKEHVYKGTYLAAVIQSAGIESGKAVSRYVEVTGADNYKAVFAFAEIDPDFSSLSIIVATSVDGKLLPEGEGPFRIIAPNDKKLGRWVRQVTSIKIVSVK